MKNFCLFERIRNHNVFVIVGLVASLLFSAHTDCGIPVGQSSLDVSHEVSLPSVPLQILKPIATIHSNAISEPSGLEASHQYPGIFWTHNDSGDRPRLFAIRPDGSSVPSNSNGEVSVSGATNVDWEDIAADTSGYLYVGDCGNNDNLRMDLAIYVIKEPNPEVDTSVTVLRTLHFYYPEQNAYPPQDLNFDAEAIFWAKGKLFLLTKHRSDSWTTLYRFDSIASDRLQPLKKISRLDIKGMVTAADASDDGTELAVLTYTGVWLFRQTADSDDFFAGTIYWLPILANQCEGITLVGNTIFICNEQKQLFQIPKSLLVPVVKTGE